MPAVPALASRVRIAGEDPVGHLSVAVRLPPFEISLVLVPRQRILVRHQVGLFRLLPDGVIRCLDQVEDDRGGQSGLRLVTLGEKVYQGKGAPYEKQDQVQKH